MCGCVTLEEHPLQRIMSWAPSVVRLRREEHKKVNSGQLGHGFPCKATQSSVTAETLRRVI